MISILAKTTVYKKINLSRIVYITSRHKAEQDYIENNIRVIPKKWVTSDIKVYL